MLSNASRNGKDNIGEYRILRMIGRGAFSKVFEAEHCDFGYRVALKSLTKNNCKFDALNLFENEMESLMRISKHKNVLGLLDAFETEDELVIVTELCEGGDLFGLLKRKFYLNETETKLIMKGLLDGLLHVHEKHQICHRDLKLENVLLTKEGTVVLGDFGLSKSYRSVLLTRCGSEEYAAPEVILGKPYDAEKVDIWSFGVIMYTCLKGRLPFCKMPSGNSQTLYAQILGKELDFYSISGISESCKNLLKISLERNPSRRATLRELSKHDFFMI